MRIDDRVVDLDHDVDRREGFATVGRSEGEMPIDDVGRKRVSSGTDEVIVKRVDDLPPTLRVVSAGDGATEGSLAGRPRAC